MLRSNLCDYSNAYIVMKGSTDSVTDILTEETKSQLSKIMFRLNHTYQNSIRHS